MKPLPVPRLPLPITVKIVGWLALVLGAAQFVMGIPPVLMPAEKGSVLAIPSVYVTNVACTALGGIIAVYALGLLLRRAWGRKGIIVLLYATAAMVAAVPVLLAFADFSSLEDLEALRHVDVTGGLDGVGPEFWAHLKRITVLLTGAFAVMIVVVHALLARYLASPAVRAAFGKHASATSEPPASPIELPR